MNICFVCNDGIGASVLVQYNFTKFLEAEGIYVLVSTAGVRNSSPFLRDTEIFENADKLVSVLPVSAEYLSNNYADKHIPYSTWLSDLRREGYPDFYRSLVYG